MRDVDPLGTSGNDPLAKLAIRIGETAALVQFLNVHWNVHQVRVRAFQPAFQISDVGRLGRYMRRNDFHLVHVVAVRDHSREVARIPRLSGERRRVVVARGAEEIVEAPGGDADARGFWIRWLRAGLRDERCACQPRRGLLKKFPAIHEAIISPSRIGSIRYGASTRSPGGTGGAFCWKPRRSMAPQPVLPFRPSMSPWVRHQVSICRKPRFSATAAVNNQSTSLTSG